MSPYKDKAKDRAWHREHMRKKAGVKRGVKVALSEGVKPVSPPRPHIGYEQPIVGQVDASGELIPEY
mgnify:CR=1 FL=1